MTRIEIFLTWHIRLDFCLIEKQRGKSKELSDTVLRIVAYTYVCNIDTNRNYIVIEKHYKNDNFPIFFRISSFSELILSLSTWIKSVTEGITVRG